MSTSGAETRCMMGNPLAGEICRHVIGLQANYKYYLEETT